MTGYLKRYMAPKSWTTLRKGTKYVTKPSPGSHSMKEGMPLADFIKQVGGASTSTEAKKIITHKKILVDNRRVRDHKFPVGLMDTISLPDLSKHYRVLIDSKARLTLKEIKADEAKTKPCRINARRTIKGGKIQLSLTGGRSLITDKGKIGDTLILSLPDNKALKHLPLEKGATILLTAGKHAGKTASVDDVQESLVRFSVEGSTEQTKKEYVFVIPAEVMK